MKCVQVIIRSKQKQNIYSTTIYALIQHCIHTDIEDLRFNFSKEDKNKKQKQKTKQNKKKTYVDGCGKDLNLRFFFFYKQECFNIGQNLRNDRRFSLLKA